MSGLNQDLVRRWYWHRYINDTYALFVERLKNLFHCGVSMSLSLRRGDLVSGCSVLERIGGNHLRKRRNQISIHAKESSVYDASTVPEWFKSIRVDTAFGSKTSLDAMESYERTCLSQS